jgi:hypothetical protein
MKKTKILALRFALFFFLIGSSTLCWAQTPSFPDGSIPLDGGISLIIAGVIIYAGNEVRLYVKKKKVV